MQGIGKVFLLSMNPFLCACRFWLGIGLICPLILSDLFLPQSRPPSETESSETDSPENKPRKQFPAQTRFQNQGKNTISSIVGSYKSAVTKHVHRLGMEFAWQRRFYDRIIRKKRKFESVSNYIRQNLVQWNI